MTIEKPQRRDTVYVQAFNRKTGKSANMPVYGEEDPQRVIEKFRAFLAGDKPAAVRAARQRKVG